jgi:predicted nuclease of predicted toxin-antitoxin system
MKFLLDQDVYAATARLIGSLGHDVIRVSQIGMSQAADEQLLRVAREQGRLLVTRDRDYGSFVFVQDLGSGVVYLRVLPSTQNAVHSELARVLQMYSEEELNRAFVVVEPDGHRIRRLPGRVEDNDR